MASFLKVNLEGRGGEGREATRTNKATMLPPCCWLFIGVDRCLGKLINVDSVDRC
jgi:hypothetical protein